MDSRRPRVGDVVRLTGLRMQTSLNGTEGRVVQPESAEEGADLEQRSRVKVRLVDGAHKAVSIANVDVITKDSLAVNWRVGDTDIAEELRSGGVLASRAAHLDCVGLANLVFSCAARAAGKQDVPKTRIDIGSIGAKVRKGRRGMVCFHLDQVGHSFVLQFAEERAKVFQSFARDPFNADIGYSAQEWVAASAATHWSEAMRSAHARWGAGRELSASDVHELLGLVDELQHHRTPPLVDVLVRQLPPSLARAQAKWNVGRRTQHSKSGKQMIGMSPVATWTMDVLTELQGLESVSGADDLRLVVPPVSSLCESVALEIPSSLHGPLERAYTALTGQFFLPPNYLRVLHHMDHRLLIERHPSFVGWTAQTLIL